MRIVLVVAMWAIVIGLLGLLEGADFAIFLAVFMGFVIFTIFYYGWYTGRGGVGKEPGRLFGGNKGKRV